MAVRVRHDRAKTIWVAGNDPPTVADDAALNWSGAWQSTARSTNDIQGSSNWSDAAGASIVLIQAGIQSGHWQHLAINFRKDGTSVALLNGKPPPAIRSGFDYHGVPAGLAAPFLGSHGKRLFGFMDDVRILPEVLTEPEIERIRKEGAGGEP